MNIDTTRFQKRIGTDEHRYNTFSEAQGTDEHIFMSPWMRVHTLSACFQGQGHCMTCSFCDRQNLRNCILGRPSHQACSCGSSGCVHLVSYWQTTDDEAAHETGLAV